MYFDLFYKTGRPEEGDPLPEIRKDVMRGRGGTGRREGAGLGLQSGGGATPGTETGTGPILEIGTEMEEERGREG